MIGQKQVYDRLAELNINFQYIEHPEAPTIEIARQYWSQLEGKHCKNIFLRNHKGNQHYLVVFDCDRQLAIHDLEKQLGQGKLSFASPERMMKYLGLKPGSVSPFGLVNDSEKHVYVFLDETLRSATRLSFHPNDNRASLSIAEADFERYMEASGNRYEWKKLYSD